MRIQERLKENGMENAYMKRRVKSIYGIYRKMYHAEQGI